MIGLIFFLQVYLVIQYPLFLLLHMLHIFKWYLHFNSVFSSQRSCSNAWCCTHQFTVAGTIGRHTINSHFYFGGCTTCLLSSPAAGFNAVNSSSIHSWAEAAAAGNRNVAVARSHGIKFWFWSRLAVRQRCFVWLKIICFAFLHTFTMLHIIWCV